MISFTPKNTFRTCSAAQRGRRRAGFSLIEVLVVVGIIALLVGILLVALGSARRSALRGDTEATMTQFVAAAQAFQLEHRRYPGVIPDRVLAQDPQITSTQNALLEMLGGYRVLAPIDAGSGNATEVAYQAWDISDPSVFELTFNAGGDIWGLKIDVDRIGEGPLIGGQSYAPYFTPSEKQLRAVAHAPNELVLGANQRLPDLVDAWGQPIVYLRQARSNGPLFPANPINPTNFVESQFLLAGAQNYTTATVLGELGFDQTTANPQGSILNLGDPSDQQATWSKIVQHHAMVGQSQGGFVLISAGADGVFFSRIDGAGNGQNPTAPGDLSSIEPSQMATYDDIVIFGGG